MSSEQAESSEPGAYAKAYDICVENMLEPRYSPITFVRAAAIRKAVTVSLEEDKHAKLVRRGISKWSFPTVDMKQMPLLSSSPEKETDVFLFPLLMDTRASLLIFSLSDNAPSKEGSPSVRITNVYFEEASMNDADMAVSLLARAEVFARKNESHAVVHVKASDFGLAVPTKRRKFMQAAAIMNVCKVLMARAWGSMSSLGPGARVMGGVTPEELREAFSGDHRSAEILLTSKHIERAYKKGDVMVDKLHHGLLAVQKNVREELSLSLLFPAFREKRAANMIVKGSAHPDLLVHYAQSRRWTAQEESLAARFVAVSDPELIEKSLNEMDQGRGFPLSVPVVLGVKSPQNGSWVSAFWCELGWSVFLPYFANTDATDGEPSDIVLQQRALALVVEKALKNRFPSDQVTICAIPLHEHVPKSSVMVDSWRRSSLALLLECHRRACLRGNPPSYERIESLLADPAERLHGAREASKIIRDVVFSMMRESKAIRQKPVYLAVPTNIDLNSYADGLPSKGTLINRMLPRKATGLEAPKTPAKNVEVPYEKDGGLVVSRPQPLTNTDVLAAVAAASRIGRSLSERETLGLKSSLPFAPATLKKIEKKDPKAFSLGASWFPKESKVGKAPFTVSLRSMLKEKAISEAGSPGLHVGAREWISRAARSLPFELANARTKLRISMPLSKSQPSDIETGVRKEFIALVPPDRNNIDAQVQKINLYPTPAPSKEVSRLARWEKAYTQRSSGDWELDSKSSLAEASYDEKDQGSDFRPLPALSVTDDGTLTHEHAKGGKEILYPVSLRSKRTGLAILVDGLELRNILSSTRTPSRINGGVVEAVLLDSSAQKREESGYSDLLLSGVSSCKRTREGRPLRSLEASNPASFFDDIKFDPISNVLEVSIDSDFDEGWLMLNSYIESIKQGPRFLSAAFDDAVRKTFRNADPKERLETLERGFITALQSGL